MIANHAGESHDGAGRLVRHQRLVLGQLDRLLGQFDAQNDGGHRVWSLPRELVERMLEHVVEHAEAVFDAAGGAGQVHDQRAPR